jgi:hypothetical protein
MTDVEWLLMGNYLSHSLACQIFLLAISIIPSLAYPNSFRRLEQDRFGLNYLNPHEAFGRNVNPALLRYFRVRFTRRGGAALRADTWKR